MEVKVLNERRNELSDGLSVWYEFEYMGNIGEYSVNEYKSENNVVHCITLEDDLYVAWESNRDNNAVVYPEGFDEVAFREAFKECFDIDIPEA
jgi:hypothetical protein